MNHSFALSTVLAACLLAACATNPTTPPELSTARDSVAQAERDSDVLSFAPMELKKATEALARANALSAKGDSLAEVASAAYVANTQARAALAVAHAKRDETTIKTAETARERARADGQTAQAERAKAQASEATADAQAARSQASDAQQQASMSRQQAAVAQGTAISSQQEASRLQQQLTDLQAKATDRGMLVTLGDVLFEFGRTDIKPGARESLRKLATYLQQHPERRILVEGFTDSVGGEGANLALSQRRAEAVASALGTLSVSPERIRTQGYGEGYPIADNATDTNRALNRRVEVYISDNDQPVRPRS